MKAFVVLALVASVASQGLMNLEFNKPTTHRLSTLENLLLKEKLGGENVLDAYKYWNTNTDMTMDWETISTLPLFSEYMRLPLFAKLWEEHPVLLRRYVESPLFQRFFFNSEFKMYFRNPVLFYKYIVPTIEAISEVTTTEGRYNFDTPTYTKYMPYAYRHANRDWSVPMSMDKIFNQRTTFPMTTGTNYRYLLEKMMNHLNLNKQHDLTETLTDVRMVNGMVQEQTVGKIVDPITGLQKITLGDIKTVDEKIVPVHSMDFPIELDTLNKHYYGMDNLFNTESMKDALIKHIILQKILGNKRISPSVYETLFKDNEELMTPEIYSRIYKHKNVMIPEMLEAIMENKKQVLTPELFQTILRNKDMNIMHPEVFQTLFGKHWEITPEVYEILSGNKWSPRTLETIFGNKIYNKEVYGTLFNNDKMMMNPEFYGQTYEPFMLKNKMMSPFVTRMLGNNKMNKFEKMIQTEKMIDEIKMIDQIKKEKMIEKMMENRVFNKDTIDFPKMYETEHSRIHVPLTFEDRVAGSVLEGFENKNEIQY